MMSCVAQKASDKPYFESLSEVRPRVTVPPDTASSTSTTVSVIDAQPVSFTKTVNEKVDVVLDSIDRFNLTRRSVDGYTIQIYSGQNREEAMNTKKKMTTDLPELTANLQYQQPKFRVTVGKYYSKLEAYQDLSTLRSIFPAAILVPEKIAIR
jgi:septal ring-binding cell division protein DamX